MTRFAASFSIAVLLAAASGLPGAGGAMAREITVAEYRSGMEKVLAELDGAHLAEAQQAAAKLEGADVSVPAGNGSAFSADASILQPIRKAAQLSDAQALSPRIKALLHALSAGDPPSAAENAPNRELLAALQRDEERTIPPKDGEIDDAGIVDSGVIHTMLHYLGEGVRWIYKKIWDFITWFRNLFPKPNPGFGDGIGPFVKYGLIGCALLAGAIMIRAYMKNRRFKGVAADFETVAAPAPAKDADPLSRDSNQWEEYAARLASTGRHREAVRAWYHAVLVMLFRSGVLNYRKGRTNWEYYFSFPQDFSFRRDFQELTGSFELEWYGKSASEPDDANRYASAAKQFLARARAGRSG